MKKKLGIYLAILAIMFGLLPNSVSAEEDISPVVEEEIIIDTAFPDEIFKEYVKRTFDTNSDGTLSQSECDNVKEIYVYNNKINSLEGIQFFLNLEVLSCSGNNLTSLDVSNNLNLTLLDCFDNNLTSLDVSNNLNLTSLTCYINNLTSLDVSKNLKLEDLDCDSNNFTNLDISNNLNLTYLCCFSNQLTSLDVSNNLLLDFLDCEDNKLSSLDVSNNLLLEFLDCEDNKLSSLNLNGLVNFWNLSINNQTPELLINYNNQSKKWEVDFNELAIPDNILVGDNNWEYDITSGIASYIAEGFPKEINYEYIVIDDSDQTMLVSGFISLSESGNRIKGINSGELYTIGDDINFTAIGAAFDKEIAELDDERYRPTTWSLNDETYEWDATKEEFSATTPLSKEGVNTLNVSFVKEKYDGTSWKAMDDGLTRAFITNEKSISFEVKAKPEVIIPKEENKAPLITPQKQSQSVATGDTQNIWFFVGIFAISALTLLTKKARKN